MPASSSRHTAGSHHLRLLAAGTSPSAAAATVSCWVPRCCCRITIAGRSSSKLQALAQQLGAADRLQVGQPAGGKSAAAAAEELAAGITHTTHQQSNKPWPDIISRAAAACQCWLMHTATAGSGRAICVRAAARSTPGPCSCTSAAAVTSSRQRHCSLWQAPCCGSSSRWPLRACLLSLCCAVLLQVLGGVDVTKPESLQAMAQATR